MAKRELAKVTKVKLAVPSLGMEREFLPSEAEALLKMPNNGGWVLPEGSPFEFDGDAIKPRTAKKRAD